MPTNWRLFCLLLKQWCQVCLCHSYGLGNLYHDAFIEVEFIPLMELVTILVVGVAQVISGLVIDHDTVIERMEFEIAILPSLLLSSDVMGEEAAKLGDRCGVLRGGQSRGTRRAS